MEKHDFSNLATGTGSQKCEKVQFHDFHEIFMKITKNPGIFRISRNFDKIIKKIEDADFALFSNENQWNLGKFQPFSQISLKS